MPFFGVKAELHARIVGLEVVKPYVGSISPAHGCKDKIETLVAGNLFGESYSISAIPHPCSYSRCHVGAYALFA